MEGWMDEGWMDGWTVEHFHTNFAPIRSNRQVESTCMCTV